MLSKDAKGKNRNYLIPRNKSGWNICFIMLHYVIQNFNNSIVTEYKSKSLLLFLVIKFKYFFH